MMVTAAVFMLLSLAPRAQAANGWTYLGDGIWSLDTDSNGIVEEVRIDEDGDDIAEIIIYDFDQDGLTDWLNIDLIGGPRRETWINPYQYQGVLVYADINEDGRYELAVYDMNRDGVYDFEFLDTNGDGHADEWFSMSGFNNSRANIANLDRYLNNFSSRMLDQNFSMINP